jgi:pimeloyl-ACP methyl ester carboxylesterase
MPSLYMKEQGDGIPLVFLHGFCETQAIWDSFIPPFTAHNRVVTVDIPGFGESQIYPGHVSIARSAEEVLTALKTRGISQAIVVGHSMGGYLSLEMAAQYPGFCKGLVLFHSTAYADSIEKKHSRNKTVEFVKKFGAQRFVETFVPHLFYKAPEEIIKSVVEIASSTTRASLISYTEAMRDRPDHTDTLKKAGVPVLFIAGEHDTAVPAAAAKEQAHIPSQAELHILEGVGHMGMFEAREKCQKILNKFLPLCR